MIGAVVPGVSRAGSTIMGARVLRVDRPTAAEFSFFLAMPTMLGASVYDLYKNWSTLDWHGSGTIALGFVVAFFSAIVVVKPFVRFISRHGFGVFAWYRIVIGAQSERAIDLMKKIYEPFMAPILVTDINSAELIKHAAN